MLLASAIGRRRNQQPSTPQSNTGAAGAPAHGRGQRQRPGGKLVRGLASGIGLASEAIHHHNEKKKENDQKDTPTTNTQQQQEHFIPGQYNAPGQYGAPDQYNEAAQYDEQHDLSRQVDEASWQLDEAQEHIRQADAPPYTVKEEDLPQMAERFLYNHPMPQHIPGTLSLPVIITQRRPGERARGFLRAYAPLLENVGIDQTTFLDFLDDLNKAVMPSPWIQALNLAALSGHFVPEPVSLAIAIAVKMAVDVGNEVHSRYKTNVFLDRINESFFAPRGLVAVVMTWKPSQPGQMITQVNMGEVASAVNGENQGSMSHKFASSNGKTAFEWPETAPLIFPALDDLATKDDNEKKGAVKRSGAFVQEYMDRRARAEWTGQNPDSNMANMAPKAEFHSRYADPNHPASSGDPLALLTGGYVQSPLSGGGISNRRGATGDRYSGRLGGRRGERGGLRAQFQDPQDPQGPQNNYPAPMNGRQGLREALPFGGVKGVMSKIMEKDILYLMIVQRPTPEEMARADAYLGAQQGYNY